jgi:hypothetical protein
MPGTFSTPKKVRPKRKVPNDGRPTKQTPELVQKLCAALAMGLNDEEAASVAGISDVTLTLWRRDQDFLAKIKYATAARLYKRLERIESGAEGWQGTSWCLERLYGARFAKPEIQLSFNNNSLTQNFLSISISATEAKEIELVASPIRESVQKRYAQYRPGVLGNGNNGGKENDVEAILPPEPEQEVAGMPVITHQVGDENRQTFWRTLVSSDPEKTQVARETALLVSRIVLAEALGYRAAGMKIEFEDNPVRLSDVLSAIDKSCDGPSGWQAMQKKSGIRAQP